MAGSPEPTDRPDGDPRLAAAAPATSDIRRRSWRFGGGAFAILIAVALLAGYFFRLDYVALMPGTARDTEPLVEVEGTEAFASDGEILFTTVRLRQRINFWEYLYLQLDDDVELIEEDLVLGDRTPDENREVNLQLMTDSKDLAVAVALEQLGFETIEENGVIVFSTVEGAAAEGVIEPGDLILSVAGLEVLSARQLVEALGAYQPGDPVEFGLERHESGLVEEVTITLGANPDNADAAFLGVAPQTLLDISDPPVDFDVAIDSGSVGGPSAGLAFTLAILDELTPGDLTGGVDVAVTGEIRADGSVGSVGGVRQKAAAVRDLGVEVFIVPAELGEDTIASVIERAGPNVRVVPVADLTEALAVLEELGGDVDSLSEFAAGVSS